MARALLDVNVLIALIDAAHAEHEHVHAWARHGLNEGWASCAVTENGLVRIMSQPRYPDAVTPTQAIDLLLTSRTNSDHAFWPCDVSLTTALDSTRLLGPGQVTDAYLLALAVHHDGTLVTLDQRIELTCVPGAKPRHLTVI